MDHKNEAQKSHIDNEAHESVRGNESDTAPNSQGQSIEVSVLLKRIEHLENTVEQWEKRWEAKPDALLTDIRKKKTNTMTTTVPLPTNAAKEESMYVDMFKDGIGRFNKKIATRPTDGKEVKHAEPPYVYTTYWSKNVDDTTHNKEKTVLELRSKELIELMRGVMRNMIAHEASSVWKKCPITVRTSSSYLAHSIQSLRDAALQADKEASDPTRDILSQLLDDYECYEPEIVRARETVYEEQALSYEKVWCLFPPGSQIVGWPFPDGPQVFTMHRHQFKDSAFVITCWSYDWDGNNLVRVYYDFKIPKFQDVKSVTDLPCYPLLFCANEAELRQQLIVRGKKFRDYSIVPETMPLYRSTNFFAAATGLEDGQWLLTRDSDYMRDSGNILTEIKASKHYDHDIIIDAALTRRYANHSYQRLGEMKSIPVKACECAMCSLDSLQKSFEISFKTGSQENGQFDQFYSLLPPRLHGYLLGRKQWGQILVETVKAWNDEHPKRAWDNLALTQKHKDNIQAMVSAYFRREANTGENSANIVDPIPGKGEGVVLLLHGIPGVGKTMTAETLARSLGRRLLRIDASDFQQRNAGQVTNVLKRHFHMASSWGALLLLDEADVFLQLRKRSELEQNALVSVLLRELEYFHGVLIMTTNRIVSIDYAVQSRIHYAVRFKELSEEAISKIWHNFRDQLSDDNCDKEEREKIDQWFKYGRIQLGTSKFTGRDIRNVFLCAQLLGYPKITEQNFVIAVESTTSFRSDLDKTNQKIANQQAIGDD